MFTGIVEDTGLVAEIADSGGVVAVTLESPILADLPIGASISVNGACLTAVSVFGSNVSVELVPETMSRTTFGRLSEGDRVNLERPMTPQTLFDGHIVQGHVDGVGTVDSVEVEGASRRMAVEVPEDLMRYIVEKGSVAVDGVSLTVAAVSESGFEVAIIPHTLEVTTLGQLEVGDRVNLEVDVLAKYVERLLKK
ncbi:MAG TPA: riboflavin synthase [Acidimicrobiia bacterium]